MKTWQKVLLAFAINVAIAAAIFYLLPPQYSGLTAVTGAIFFGYVLYLSQNHFQRRRNEES